MTKKEKGEINLSKSLEKLSAIAEWFENQDEVDVEEGLNKVREAAELIKESRGRLKKIENEFEILKLNIEEGDAEEKEEVEEVETLPF